MGKVKNWVIGGVNSFVSFLSIFFFLPVFVPISLAPSWLVAADRVASPPYSNFLPAIFASGKYYIQVKFVPGWDGWLTIDWTEGMTVLITFSSIPVCSFAAWFPVTKYFSFYFFFSAFLSRGGEDSRQTAHLLVRAAFDFTLAERSPSSQRKRASEQALQQ